MHDGVVGLVLYATVTDRISVTGNVNEPHFA